MDLIIGLSMLVYCYYRALAMEAEEIKYGPFDFGDLD